MNRFFECLKESAAVFAGNIKIFFVVGLICMLPSIPVYLKQSLILPDIPELVILAFDALLAVTASFMTIITTFRAYNIGDEITTKQLLVNAKNCLWRFLNVLGRLLLVVIGASVAISLFWGILNVSYTVDPLILWTGIAFSIAAVVIIFLPRYCLTFVSAAVSDWGINDMEYGAGLMKKKSFLTTLALIITALLAAVGFALVSAMTYTSPALTVVLMVVQYLFSIFAFAFGGCVWARVYAKIEEE